MLKMINVYWVEGYFAEIDKKIHASITEETFKDLVNEGFESCADLVEFIAGRDGSDSLTRHYIVRVENVVPFEDQYVTIGEYTLMA